MSRFETTQAPSAGEGASDSLPSFSAHVGAAPRLLPTVSIVDQTIGEARRALSLALGGVLLLLTLLIGERWWFLSAQQEASQRHARVLQLAAELQLSDFELTAAAQMAVATGDRSWVDRFDRELPAFDKRLDAVRRLAPSGAASEFDEQTEGVTRELAGMRESAFEAITVNQREVARSVFESTRYRQLTVSFRRATDAIAQASVVAARSRIEELQQRSTFASATLVTGMLLLGALLWARLVRRLTRSRHHLLGAEERIQRLAASDLLTGLPNRAALHDAMASAMARAESRGSELAVLMMDLDGFKPVNDRHGHMVGDLVLKEVALRLKSTLRGNEIRARYGGDEFVVLVQHDAQPEVAQTVAERVVQAIREPMQIDQQTLCIGASVGIARYPDDGCSADELLRKADSALYRAKDQSRGDICYYDVSLDEQVAERAALEQAIRDGVERGEFIAFLQPIVNLSTRRVTSVEVLARWQHPQRGLVAPAQFIPIAEASGLVGPLMMGVLRHACSELWRLPSDWRLSVNLAPQQLLDEQLVPQLLSLLAEYRVPPSRLDLELTESALVTDTAIARQVMQHMKQAGITVTLDDFGTGYSSLCYLAEMSFDKIKIDRSFVHTLRERPESVKIVDAIIGLSRSLGVQTVAEGIETEEDAERVQRMGCTMGQGYLYGKPAPMATLAERWAVPKAPATA